MPSFKISAEHVPTHRHADIKKFCKDNRIRCSSVKEDDVFSNFAHVRVSGDTKRVANKVRDFIWNEVNGGAYCNVAKIS